MGGINSAQLESTGAQGRVDRIDIRAKLMASSLLEGVEPELVDELSHDSSVQLYRKGASVFALGEEADRLYIVLSGWVKIFRSTFDGDEAVVDTLRAPLIFGEESVFEKSFYSHSALAISSTRLIQIHAPTLRRLFPRSQDLLMNLLREISVTREQKDIEIEHRALQNAPQRIGCFILHLVDENIDLDQPIEITLPYDKNLIAARLGMKAETFSRALNKLNADVGLRSIGSRVRIDEPKKLFEYSCVKCSKVHPCLNLNL